MTTMFGSQENKGKYVKIRNFKDLREDYKLLIWLFMWVNLQIPNKPKPTLLLGSKMICSDFSNFEMTKAMIWL